MKIFFIALLAVSINPLFGGSCCNNGSCCDTKSCCNGGSCCGNDSCCTNKSNTPVSVNNKDSKNIIKEAYGKVATQSGSACSLGGCCGSIGGCCGGGAQLSEDIGYTKEELEKLADANLGLGCGNPTNLGQLKEGDTVLDLGSGAGLDCFLAAIKVGSSGKVIGVDMTPEMISKARQNARKYKLNNVEFRMGDIEELPVENGEVDVIMSNCVINLAPNKEKVFQEAYRVLKSGGKMTISDVVLTGNLTQKQKNDEKLLCACVSGAILKDKYLSLLKKAGFDVKIIDEDKNISQKWFGNKDLPIASLLFVATKK